MSKRGVVGVLWMAGCLSAGACSPPPPRVPVPAEGTIGPPRYDPAKPLPGQVPPAQQQQPRSMVPADVRMEVQSPPPVDTRVTITQTVRNAAPGYDPRIAAPPADQVMLPPPPAPGSYNDVPLVRDRPPEQRAFVAAYNAVGRPKIAIFVNRRLDGAVTDIDDGYLRPGQYDEAQARSLDYAAVESILTDWLAAGGNAEVISPTLARAKLTAEQQTALDRGEPLVLSELSTRLDAQIFVQVQARPTRQTTQGLAIRLVAEAINVRGGRSIARAVVDVPPPLEKPTVNEYTRFVARKLMDDMTATWTAPAPAPATAPAPR